MTDAPHEGLVLCDVCGCHFPAKDLAEHSNALSILSGHWMQRQHVCDRCRFPYRYTEAPPSEALREEDLRPVICPSCRNVLLRLITAREASCTYCGCCFNVKFAESPQSAAPPTAEPRLPPPRAERSEAERPDKGAKEEP